MHVKKWLKYFIVFSSTLLLWVAFINLIVDPIWVYPYSNKLNNKQTAFDERQLKLNKFFYTDLKNSDSLLLGSSRTTYINQNHFKNMKVFNMGAGNMFPYEYKGYIEILKKIKGKDFKNIIIGIDFFGTRVPEKKIIHKSAKEYFDITNSCCYRIKMLFNIDVLKYSLRNINNLYTEPVEYYNRNNIRLHKILSPKVRKKNFKLALKGHLAGFKNNYIFNPNYKRIFEELKQLNPNTNFYIFTTPATAELLVSTISVKKRFDDYKKWLHILVSVFGKVYHFYDINSITINKENYPDDEHYYPIVGDMIINKLESKNLSKINPNDFGVILSKHNMILYMRQLKEKIYSMNIKAIK